MIEKLEKNSVTQSYLGAWLVPLILTALLHHDLINIVYLYMYQVNVTLDFLNDVDEVIGLVKQWINRGSYMSAHVLLNLLNKLRISYKMRGLPSILSLFRNKFNKFNKTRARMLDSIHDMTLRLL